MINKARVQVLAQPLPCKPKMAAAGVGIGVYGDVSSIHSAFVTAAAVAQTWDSIGAKTVDMVQEMVLQAGFDNIATSL